MTVSFVGAGPGAPDLLTVRAQRMIADAEVVLYAGSLVPLEVLAGARPGARLVDTAGLDLDAITDELVSAHRDGHDVVRLHSGDPSIFSAVAEQARRLDAEGVPWQIIPGVPAFAAAAAGSCGRPSRSSGRSRRVSALYRSHRCLAFWAKWAPFAPSPKSPCARWVNGTSS